MYAERLREIAKRRDVIPGKRLEQITLALFQISGVAMMLGGFAEFVLLRHSANWITYACGVPVAVASFFIRRSAIRALGKFWSLHVEIRAEHQFVKTGPFQFVRHPAYSSMVLELAAGALILQAWWSGMAALLVFIPTMVWRIRVEEEALVEKFGDAYREFQRTTPMLIPRIPCTTP